MSADRAEKFRVVQGGAANGGGPEDPMLEQRVGRLEEKVDRIEAISMRLEPQISEVLRTGVKQADLTKLLVRLYPLRSRRRDKR